MSATVAPPGEYLDQLDEAEGQEAVHDDRDNKEAGASTNVGFEYWAGTNRGSYLMCGNNDFPAYSLRIFVG